MGECNGGFQDRSQMHRSVGIWCFLGGRLVCVSNPGTEKLVCTIQSSVPQTNSNVQIHSANVAPGCKPEGAPKSASGSYDSLWAIGTIPVRPGGSILISDGDSEHTVLHNPGITAKSDDTITRSSASGTILKCSTTPLDHQPAQNPQLPRAQGFVAAQLVLRCRALPIAVACCRQGLIYRSEMPDRG